VLLCEHAGGVGAVRDSQGLEFRGAPLANA